MSKTARTLKLLEYLSDGHPPATHAELMRALGIQRSTLSDLLAELHALGYLEVRDRRYLPGLRLLALVHRAVQQPSLGESIRPTLEALTAATGETAVYVIARSGRDGVEHVVAVDQTESPQPIRYVADIGTPFPMSTTAAGRALLAADEGPASRLPTLPAADGEREAFAAELETVRRQGYAVHGDVMRATAIAAPLYDRVGALLGAISIVGPSERFDAPAAWAVLEPELGRLRDGSAPGLSRAADQAPDDDGRLAPIAAG